MQVIAHQGGWDELALFAVPIVLALIGVRLAEARAKRRRETGDEAEHGGDPSAGG